MGTSPTEVHFTRHSTQSKARTFLAALKEATTLSPRTAERGGFVAGDRVEGNYSSGVWYGNFDIIQDRFSRIISSTLPHARRVTYST